MKFFSLWLAILLFAWNSSTHAMVPEDEESRLVTVEIADSSDSSSDLDIVTPPTFRTRSLENIQRILRFRQNILRNTNHLNEGLPVYTVMGCIVAIVFFASLELGLGLA